MSSPVNLKKRNSSLFTSTGHTGKTGLVFFVISLFLHCLVFAGMMFFQDFKLPRPMPPVIQIDLVSFAPEPALEEPAKGQESLKKDQVSIKTPAIIKKNRKIPTIKADISLKTKPKNIKDLIAQQEQKKKKPEKKKPEKKKIKKPVEKPEVKAKVDSEQVKEKAKGKSEKKLEDQDLDQDQTQDQDQIAQALARLQKKVKHQGKTKEGEAKGAYAGYGKKGYKPIDLYKMVLGSAIEQNWVFNDILARMDQNLEVRILIKILKSGNIRDIIYETKSGNRYLDESAKKAIKKANPLPQLPAGMRSYDVVVIFTPKGLK